MHQCWAFRVICSSMARSRCNQSIINRKRLLESTIIGSRRFTLHGGVALSSIAKQVAKQRRPFCASGTSAESHQPEQKDDVPLASAPLSPGDLVQKDTHPEHEHDESQGQKEEDEDMESMFEQGPAGTEWNGPTRGGRHKEPTRYGDWEKRGRCYDFS